MMHITVKNDATIDSTPDFFKKIILSQLTIQNPKWLENHKMGRWNKNTPKILKFYKSYKNKITVPRGYLRSLISLAKSYNIPFEITDKRNSQKLDNINFNGELKNFQKDAVKQILKKDFGTISAPTGCGKTVIALYLIAIRKEKTLVIVHSKDLAMQWIRAASKFLNIDEKEIGIIGMGKYKVGNALTVAIVNSVYKRAEELKNTFGYLIVDECHRVPSRTFQEAAISFNTRFMTGLSATPYRRDNLSKLIFWYLGDLMIELDKSILEEKGDILKAEVVVRFTEFASTIDPSGNYTTIISELTQDKKRNKLIASDVYKESLNNKGICLVLSDRKQHCELLHNYLKYNFKCPSLLLTGDTKVKERIKIVDALNGKKEKILIATGQLVGEGFDCKELNILFLTTPIKFSGRLLQYLGRILRPAPNKKKATIYDYVDINVRVLENMARERQKVYYS